MATSQEVKGPLQQDSSTKLKEEFVKMLQIIMSSKTKEEQQNEAFHRLRSNPELLLLLLQDIFNIGDKGQAPSTSNPEHVQNKPDSQFVYEAESVEEDIVEDTDATSMEEENSPDVETPQALAEGSESDVTGRTDSESTDESFASFGDGIYPKRVRKSKYADIKGDLSHIRREPKCSKTEKVEKQLRNKLRKKEKISKIQKQNKQKQNKQKVDSVPLDNDVLLVRKFMDILMYPKSRNHQECVLAVLRSDPRLMKLFLKEKANMGKQKIPVFKRTQCTGQKFSPENSEVQHTTERECSIEEIVLPVSETNTGNALSEDSDSLLSFLVSALKTNKVVIPEKDINGRQVVSEKHRIHTDRPSIFISNIPNENFDTNDSLGRPVFSSDLVQGIVCPSIAISSSSQDPHFSLLDQISERVASPSGSERSLDLSGGDVTTFDISLHEHFQNLSRDLFQVNNPTAS